MSKLWLEPETTTVEPRDCFGDMQAGGVVIGDESRCTVCGCAGVHGCMGPSRRWQEELVAEVRRLRAVLGQNVRALLEHEWDGDDRPDWCRGCGVDMDSEHHDDCDTHTALIAAGLPDQASRDAARAEIAKR
jgi:hypothetical protein